MPGRVKEVRGNYALVDYGGATKKANIEFIPHIQEGDYVVVHVGYAISRLSHEEAQKSLETWKELLESLRDGA